MIEEKFWIWSIEHNAWWRPMERGYTHEIQDAGIYTKEKAVEICFHANEYLPTNTSGIIVFLNEIMIKVQDIRKV